MARPSIHPNIIRTSPGLGLIALAGTFLLGSAVGAQTPSGRALFLETPLQGDFSLTGFNGSEERMAEIVATLQQRGHQVVLVEEQT